MRETPVLVGAALVVLGASGCNSGAAEYQLGPAARVTTAETHASNGNLLETEVPPPEVEATGAMAAEAAAQEVVGGETSPAESRPDRSYLGRPASSWIEQLEDSWDVGQRLAAVSILKEIGPDAERVTLALIEALGDRNPTVREAAASTLQSFGPQIVSDLSRVLFGHSTHSVRAGAARALAPLAASDPEVMDSLIRATSDRSSLVRRVSVEVIGQAGEAASDAVPALIEALLDEDPNVRASAAIALGWIGPAADAAIPALTVASLDTVARVAAAAREALIKVDMRD